MFLSCLSLLPKAKEEFSLSEPEMKDGRLQTSGMISAIGNDEIMLWQLVSCPPIHIRMSDTICVQERLPAGAAGVLINQTHTYRDLYRPIDSTEKGLFDAIDWMCTIGGIAREHGQPDTVRAIFERLWWHALVVFHTSH
jgi:hypothetical protein